jgi:shikimate kinase
LKELYAQRDPLYMEVADFVVDTGGQPVSAIVAAIENNL